MSCLHSLLTHQPCSHLSSSVDFSPLLGPDPFRLAVYELLLRSSLTSPNIPALCSYPPSPELYKALHTAADFPLPPVSQSALAEKAAADVTNVDALGCVAALGSAPKGHIAAALLGIPLGPYDVAEVLKAGEAVRKEVRERESRH